MAGMNEGHVIDVLGHAGEEFGHPGAGPAMLPEWVGGLHDQSWLPEKPFVFAFALQGFAMKSGEVWLVIECVKMADASGAKDLNDALGPWSKMRRGDGS